MLILKKEFLQQIIAQSKKEYPKECCGIFAGRNNEAEILYPLENVSKEPQVAYEIDSRQLLKIFKELRAKNLEMVAIYHSHTETEAYPSERDLELAFYPDSFYLIVSLRNKDKPEVRAFKIKDKEIQEVKIIS
jgi:proteasome lid subunit RPN8/RPN11